LTYLILIGLAWPAHTGDCPEVVADVQFGPAHAAALTESHLFFDAGGLLRVAEISDPSSPIVIGEALAGGVVADIEVAGGTALVLLDQRPVGVFDVSDPTTPEMVGYFGSFGDDVELVGSLALLAGDGLMSLKIYDLSDPSSPQLLGGTDNLRTFLDVEVHGSLVFAAAGFDGVQVLDISDPTNPHEIGSIACTEFIRTIEVIDDLLLVGDGSQLNIYALGSSSSWPLLGSTALSAPFAFDIAASGTLAHVGFSNGMDVVDLSDPASPARVGWSNHPDSGEPGLAALGAIVAFCAPLGSLSVIDVTDPTSPSTTASIEAPGDINALVATGGHLFTAHEAGG